jgi:hypothetical protein
MRDEELNRILAEDAERAFDDRIVTALERKPDLSSAIPDDFAARVAAQVPAKRPVMVRATSYGRTAMWVGLAVSMVVLIGITVRGSASPAVVVVEWTLCLQFLAFAVWLGVRRLREG